MPAARCLCILAVLGSANSFGAACALSQEVPADNQTPIEQVVVTARYRPESLDAVPIALTALSARELESRNLNNIQDIARQVPYLDFRTGASNKDRTIFIRGIGTITTSPGAEPSVSTVVDGVVMARPGQATLDLIDVERIEILRGPQGTLFGMNASAGVVNIVSKMPSAERAASLGITYFEGNEYRMRGDVSGPLTQDGSLLYAVSGLRGAYDGNVRNIVTGATANGYERTGVRGKLVYRPDSGMALTAGADYMKSRDTVPTAIFVATDRIAFPTGSITPDPTLAAILKREGITPSLDNRTISANFNTHVDDENYGASLQADIAAGGGLITSITAYREWRNWQYQDWDGFSLFSVPDAPGILLQGIDLGQVYSRQFSQEARFTSAGSGFVSYVAGVFYFHATTDEIYRRDVLLPIASLPLANHAVARYGVTMDNVSLYGEANLNFTSRFRGLIGGRLIVETLDFHHRRDSHVLPGGVPGVADSFAGNGSTNDTNYALRTGLQYDLAQDAMAYITYSRGYKGPAYNVFFNMGAGSTAPLPPETSDAYEAGLKASAPEWRLQGSIALFAEDFHGYQTNYQDLFQGAIITRLTSAAAVTTRGVEMDAVLAPLDRLMLNINLAFMDAYIVRIGCPAGTVCTNYDGKPLPFAPKWKLHGGATYTTTLTDRIDLELTTDYVHRSDTQYSLAQVPQTIQPAYGIWNASVALLGSLNSHDWQLRGIVSNILDKHYSPYLSYGTVGGVTRFVPRDNGRYVGIVAKIGL